MQPKIRFKGYTAEWNTVKINKVLEKVKENDVKVVENELYREIGIRSHGRGIFYKEPVLGKDLGNKSVFWVHPNVFVLNIVFAWERAVARTTENEIGMIASHRFPMYKPKANLIDVDFITRFFITQKGKYLLELASPGGAGRNKTLGQKEFENLQINIPSLEEQQKIASFFTLFDQKIDKQQEKIEQLELFKKAMMQKIFSQEIRFKDENGKEFPNWKETYLGDIGETYGGLSGKTKDDFGIGESYFITYMNVFSNVVAQIEGVERVSIKENENQHKVKLGDILFTTSSETPEEVGMASVWNHDIPDVYLNSFCFGFRLTHDVDPVFLAYMLRSSSYRKIITLMAQGSTRYNLSKTNLMKMKVHLPQKAEQEKIKLLLLKLDQKILMETEKLNELKLIKKGFMQQMFV
ncbi:restriction endonuclease subunit S [Brevibacillus borstelensis]|uniref:restriction endonuclease subunit S n=1 Tax=Brevibacillus borstelensis TaxID=45462 RepID=UPI002E1FCF74|nr:restriction endonuclease subunit S [Brevibacillus borstelensis]MED2010640.1 restriction endonuclease subunit S [Brevibacillus borstelensis]